MTYSVHYENIPNRRNISNHSRARNEKLMTAELMKPFLQGLDNKGVVSDWIQGFYCEKKSL